MAALASAWGSILGVQVVMVSDPDPLLGYSVSPKEKDAAFFAIRIHLYFWELNPTPIPNQETRSSRNRYASRSGG